MLRQEVLKLYRDVFRTIRQVPDESSRQELRLWARHDFRSSPQVTDELTIKMKLQQGRRNLNELRTSLALSGVITEPAENSKSEVRTPESKDGHK